eukprot:NODE_566_length_1478_cov_575.817990.p1 GENE.NODE_566_length_1478_cov_575.817990~~NODE_566_length_1478_cov_575.817990.p1  ORF type:complete len:398 (+),score=127.57 NODE_566_length_1478_cov_575.817990:149-1342(+)
MQSFDAFGKPIQEFRVTTACGGYISVCSFCLIFLLFLSELSFSLQLHSKDEMLLDQNQHQKYLNISLDVTFPSVPCALLSMNLLDPKRANVMHVNHGIYKTRLSRSGEQLGQRIRDSFASVARSSAELVEEGSTASKLRAPHVTPHLRCGSCFHSHLDEDDCCTTCDDVQKAFLQHGWDPKPADYVFGQCAQQAYLTPEPEVGEGCRMEATLHVRKVASTIHLGVGRFVKADWLARKDRTEYVNTLNLTHVINSIAFGPDFPGLIRVLDGRVKNHHNPGQSEHFQYEMHVIPTYYKEDGVDGIESHQYSVLEYVKSIDPRRGKTDDQLALGLWATYDFTPFEVRVTKTRQGFAHFATKCCAILGGIFAFSGMVDNFAYRIDQSLRSKRRIKVGPAGI